MYRLLYHEEKNFTYKNFAYINSILSSSHLQDLDKDRQSFIFNKVLAGSWRLICKIPKCFQSKQEGDII